MNAAAITGYAAAASVICAGLLPLLAKLRPSKGPVLESKPLQLHVLLGLGTTAAAGMHVLISIAALGDPAAVAAGNLPLALGAIAFLVITAHVGIGLQLRNPKLVARPKRRKAHQLTATAIVLLVAAHAVLLLRAG
jgi:hypothetical protein